MSTVSPITAEDRWFVGEDRTLQFRVLSHEKVRLSADAAAGATSLSVQPLEYALSNGDKLLFGRNTVVTLTAAAAAGTTALTVNAIPGLLRTGQEATKIRNITGYALEWELLRERGSATASLSKTTGSGITITDGANGLCEVSITDTDTLALTPQSYFYVLRRTDAGQEIVLAVGDALLQAAGE